MNGRVEDGRGGDAPFPFPAHQTGRADFPHPAFRLVSSRAYGGGGTRASIRGPASPWLRDTASSEGSDPFSGVSRLIANHPGLAIFESAPEVRVLPSPGVTRVQRYYDPVRSPSVPPPVSVVEAATLAQDGSPPLPASPFRRAVPTTPADRTGARVDCFPIRAAFPVLQAGQHPHLYFRGLLRLHSRYGPSDRSTAQGGLRHEASARLVARTGRSSATRSTDNSLGGTFLHWWRAPSGRTE